MLQKDGYYIDTVMGEKKRKKRYLSGCLYLYLRNKRLKKKKISMKFEITTLLISS